jgi:hypothetical protein
MPSLPQDVYDSARLVTSLLPLQHRLPATSLGRAMRQQCRMGTGRTSLQRPDAFAGSRHPASMGLPQVSQSLVRRKGLDVRTHPVEYFSVAYHPCLGLGDRQPYSAPEGKLPMSWRTADLLKQQIPLLDYLQGQGWKPTRRSAGGRLMGLCPLHTDQRPSFLVDPGKNLFYCYGCGRGGDVIRLAELYHGVRFANAMSLLRRWGGLGSPLPDVAAFYEMQLHRHADAAAYLLQRGLHRAELIEKLRIGYAPGRCLRAWLISLGYPLESLQQAGLVNAEGYDTYSHRIVFPLEGNLYGPGTAFGNIRRSFWSKGCSIWRCYGRPGSITSPVPWGIT